MKVMRDWECPKCGHEVLAYEKPQPIKWSDGHVCYFREQLSVWRGAGTEADPYRKVKVSVPKTVGKATEIYGSIKDQPKAVLEELRDLIAFELELRRKHPKQYQYCEK
jgi:hypothetical protein